jgi:hypothetical protein
VLNWETTPEHDIIVAEHDGYRRLTQPVVHRRAVRFLKRKRLWIVEDSLSGAGEHVFHFRFHFAEGLDISVHAQGIALACDKMTGARLYVVALESRDAPELEPRFTSRDYGERSASLSACWKMSATAPLILRWAIVPACASDDEKERLSLIAELRNGSGV